MNKRITWIRLGEASKLINRSMNGVRSISERERVPTRKVKYGTRDVYEYSKQHLQNIAKVLPKRKFSKERSLNPILEKSTGYMKIYYPEHSRSMSDGYVYEHWLVAEKLLGRPLKAKECVHHINRVRHDNRLENITVYPNRGHHMKDAHSHLALFMKAVYADNKDITDSDLTDKIKLISALTTEQLKNFINLCLT